MSGYCGLGFIGFVAVVNFAFPAVICVFQYILRFPINQVKFVRVVCFLAALRLAFFVLYPLFFCPAVASDF